MNQLQKQFQVSERRACRVVGQSRSTQRYERRTPDDEPELVKRMLELVRRWPRRGYRWIGAMLRAEGFRANSKRVYRLWRREGLKVPQRARKRRRLGSSSGSSQRRRAERPNEVWSWDFVFDTTSDGKTLKTLVMVDEFTRECLVLEPARRHNSRTVIDALAAVMMERGAPSFIRSDNGPEFIAKAVRSWLSERTVSTLYIEPGSPWQNAFVESFNSRLRDEFLNCEVFDHVLEARAIAWRWMEEYNRVRRHGALGYRTPVEFAAEWFQAASATLQRPETNNNYLAASTPIASGS